MIDAVVIQPQVAAGEPAVAGISWPVNAAGSVISCALC